MKKVMLNENNVISRWLIIYMLIVFLHQLIGSLGAWLGLWTYQSAEIFLWILPVYIAMICIGIEIIEWILNRNQPRRF